MTEPRIRQAGVDDALLVAALTIQAARAEGLVPEPGFMDLFADCWIEYADQHPVWWAELDGEHAGLLVAARVRPLPWPGQTGGGSVTPERLFVRPGKENRGVEDALRAAAREWATTRGMEFVES
ncbi:hypothetical protein GCM10027418_32130 [Mariniluteicoccus endophyticus]